MLLRRITEHMKAQNWTAIGLDFLIVVVGVIIGIQVANWNDARADERAYQDAMGRLKEENTETLRSAGEVRATIGGMLSDVQPAIEILENCSTTKDAEAIVNRALITIRSGRAMGAATMAIDQLVEEERLLNRQSDEQRVALRQYHSDLHSNNDTAALVLDKLSVDDSHPMIGFTGIVDPDETFNKVDVRRARMVRPLAEACKDQTFLKLFYRWERGHVFQLHLIDQLEEIVRENSRLMNPDGNKTPERVEK